jgi:hypothetical protein
VAKAFKAYELGAPKKFTQEHIFDSIKKEYQQRLQTNDIIKSDPNTRCYILRVKAVDVEYIGKYKDERAYSYWSGFVDIIHVAKCPIDTTMTFFCKAQHVHHKGFVMTRI